VEQRRDAVTSGYATLSWKQAFRQLVGQVGVYGFGNALQRLGAFVLLPLYLWRLSPEEYGLLALVGLLPFVLPQVILLGLPTTITRYYYDWTRDGSAANNLGVIWAVATGSALTATVLLDQFGESLLRQTLTQVPFEPHGRLGLWWAFFASLSLCPMMLLRIQEMGRAYVMVSQISFFLGSGLNAWAVLAGWGVVGILWMQVISSACVGLLLSGWYLTNVAFQCSGSHIVRALRLALPLVPSALLEAMASRADRFFLDKWISLQEIGLYALANQLGQGVKFFYDSIKPAWIPFYIRVAGERGDARDFLGRAITFYVAALGCVALAVLLFGPVVVEWFGKGGRFDQALPLLPILVGGFFLQGLVPLGSMAVLVAERTVWHLIIQTIQLLVVIGVNLSLTQQLGAVGAAWSLLVACGVQAGLYMGVGQQVYSVRLEWPRLGALVAGGAVAGVLAISFASAGIAVKSLWLLAYVGWVFGVVYRRGDFGLSAGVPASENVRKA